MIIGTITRPCVTLIVLVLGIEGPPFRSADAGQTPLQTCQREILKSTNKYLKVRMDKLGKCLEKRAAIELGTGDPAKAGAKAAKTCAKAAAAVERAFTKSATTLTKACQPVENAIVAPSDPLGVLRYGDCDPSLGCPGAADLATAYLCFASTEADYIASHQAPRTWGDLGALLTSFQSSHCVMAR